MIRERTNIIGEHIAQVSSSSNNLPLLVYCRSINIFLAVFLLQAILDFLQDGGFPQRPSALEKDDHLDQRWENAQIKIFTSRSVVYLCVCDVLTELLIYCRYMLGGATFLGGPRVREETKSVLKSLGQKKLDWIECWGPT